MTAYYQVCEAPSSASTCAWVEVTPSIFVPLTWEDGSYLTGLIALCWIAGSLLGDLLRFMRSHHGGSEDE